jgi:hypothetical protein
VSANIDLVCVEGPLAGERFRLSPTAALRIGRSKRGVHLADPLVSIEHAEVSWTTDRYYITDLGSMSGTFVNEKRLGREPMALAIGMAVRIGESTFNVEPRRARPAWFFPVIVLMVLIGAGTLGFMLQAARPARYEPVLTWGAPVHQGGIDSPVVPIPTPFIRQYGLDHRSVMIKKVTDYDQNGVDELWLNSHDRVFAVTFAGEGWHVLGEFPIGCHDRPTLDFPDQKCGGEYHFYEGGRYVLAGQEGVVGWVYYRADAPAGSPPGTPRARTRFPAPFRFTLVDEDRLAGFLTERGIDERIHYIICEEAFPGVRAQVLTQSGRIRPLDFGCIKEFDLYGVNEFEDMSNELPIAVAFTAAGRLALIDDVVEYLAGDPQGLFLDAQGQELRAALSAEPSPRVMMRVSFGGTELPVEPVADDRPIAGRRTLIGGEQHPEYPSAPAETVTVTGQEPVRVDPPGCSELEIRTAGWHCLLTRLCMPNDDFVTVKQLGCGAPSVLATAPYGGNAAGADANIGVRVAVDAARSPRQVDALRVRVAWRERRE